MEHESTGGRDVGPDLDRDIGDEPRPAYRDHAPDLLTPIDPDAPVSGHVPAAEHAHVASLAPEHDWEAAASLIFPVLRPVGTQGIRAGEFEEAATAGLSHTQPILGDGPCGLLVVYAIAATGFDIIVNGDHVISWAIGPGAVAEAAMANLATWSSSAPWTDEASGERRLLSSDTGDGWDAARILLPDVRERLVHELGATGRVLIGLPERHLLLAGALRQGDEEFAALFGQFVVEQSGGADEPIDRRVFELVGGELVEFVA